MNETPKTPAAQADTQDEMRRVQTGAIGIVAVLLLIGLASTLGASGRNDANASSAAVGSAQRTSDVKNEPLVELGVQPATAPETPKSEQSRAPASAATVPTPALPAGQPGLVRPDGSVPDLKPDPKAQKAVQPN